MESFNQSPDYFKYPNIGSEAGEFQRVAEVFDLDESILMFLAEEGRMTVLNEDLWNKLENTDSSNVEMGDWDKVKVFSESVGRDWLNIKEKYESGEEIDAPIVMKIGDEYHLVSGNTRLMVAKAMGIKPKILLFEVETSNN